MAEPGTATPTIGTLPAAARARVRGHAAALPDRTPTPGGIATMRLRRSRLLTTCAAGLLLAACSGGPEETDASDAPPPRDDETAEQDPAAAGEACEQAFADAETAEDGQAALMAAVAACDDIASFTAASAEHPDALGDVEPHVFLAEACDDATEPAVSESPLCDEVAGEQN